MRNIRQPFCSAFFISRILCSTFHIAVNDNPNDSTHKQTAKRTNNSNPMSRAKLPSSKYAVCNSPHNHKHNESDHPMKEATADSG